MSKDEGYNFYEVNSFFSDPQDNPDKEKEEESYA